MRSTRSVETEVLIAGCRAAGCSAEFSRIRFERVDWRRLIDRADRLGVAGHLYTFLKTQPVGASVPPSALSQLQARYYARAGRNLRLQEALRELLAAFQADGITVMVLKGAALAETVYGNLAQRPMRDLDLLVRVPDLEAAEALLFRLGYWADESYGPRAWYLQHRHHLPPFVASDESVRVELHWLMISTRVPVALPMDQIWRRACHTHIAGVPAAVPAPDDLVLHLSLHLSGSNGFWSMLGALRDIAETIRRRGGELDWERLEDTACRCGGSAHCYYALWLARTVVGAEVPGQVLEVLRRGGKGPLVDRCIKRFARRAVTRFREDTGFLPADLIHWWGRELMDGSTWRGRVGALVRKFYLRWVGVGRARGWGSWAPLYAAVIHPWIAAFRIVRRSGAAVGVRPPVMGAA